jgi:hypothetical protein
MSQNYTAAILAIWQPNIFGYVCVHTPAKRTVQRSLKGKPILYGSGKSQENT